MGKQSASTEPFQIKQCPCCTMLDLAMVSGNIPYMLLCMYTTTLPHVFVAGELHMRSGTLAMFLMSLTSAYLAAKLTCMCLLINVAN